MNKSVSSSSKPDRFFKFFLNCTISALLGIAMLFIITLVASLAINFSQKPENFYTIAVIAAYILSGLLSGAVSMRKNARSALFCGLTSGIIMIVLLFLMTLIFPKIPDLKTPFWQPIIIPVSAIIGALFSSGNQK